MTTQAPAMFEDLLTDDLRFRLRNLHLPGLPGVKRGCHLMYIRNSYAGEENLILPELPPHSLIPLRYEGWYKTPEGGGRPVPTKVIPISEDPIVKEYSLFGSAC